MENIFISPARYCQGPGLLKSLGGKIKSYGSCCMVIGDAFVLNFTRERIQKSLKEAGIQVEITAFSSECSYAEIERLSEQAKQFGAEIIVAVGGGKTLDTGKAVANNIKAASVIVPTIASTDAPTSSLVVIYNEDHVHEDVLFLPKNPDLVLVDSEIIAAAPVRFLVAGIGDAIATKYEAEACYKSDATNFQGGRCSVTALALAELCNDIILNHGISAKLSAENHLLTPSLEKVIEANILLSGLGFENGGEAVAHSFAGSLGLIPASNIAFHGEKVAVGVLIQLFLEDRPYKEIMELISFYRVIGLPTTLTELGWSEPSEEDLARVASKMCQPGSITHNMPFEVSETMVINAIKYLEHFQQDSNNVVTLENLG